MHDTAYDIGAAFFANYGRSGQQIVVEIGAHDVNGSLRSCAPPGGIYLGLDIAHGPSVDFIIDPVKPLPLRSDFADIVLSSSQMEHDPFFWNTFAEMVRITKPGGVLYVNAPSNGVYHRHPADHWRFFPDASHALVAWATKEGHPVELIESFTAARKNHVWNDYVAIYRKLPWPDEPITFLSDTFVCQNIWRRGVANILKEVQLTEDLAIIQHQDEEVRQLRSALSSAQQDISSLRAASLAEQTEAEALRSALADAKAEVDELGLQLTKALEEIEHLKLMHPDVTAQDKQESTKRSLRRVTADQVTPGVAEGVKPHQAGETAGKS